MPEANVKVQINNNDLRYDVAPIETALNICCFVDSPSGTYELVKRNSKSDFIKYNLLTNEILASEDDTVKHAGYLLNYAGLYVKRVGSCPIKQGISSLGEYLLFTEDNDLINEYCSVEVKKWNDDLEYYYIGFGKDCYYTGNGDKLKEQEKTKFNNFIEVADEKSIDLLVSYFYQHAKEDITVLASTENSITTREALSFSPNLTVTTTENVGVYNRLVNEKNATMNMGDFLQIRGYTYYFQGNGSFIPNRYTNPVAIYSNKDINSMDAGIFFIKVMSRVQDDATVYNPMPEVRGNGGLKLSYKGVTGKFTLTEACKQKMRLFENDTVLGIFDNDDEIENGTIKCLFKKDPTPQPQPVINTIESTASAANGNASLSSKTPISPKEDTTYKITLGKVTNTFKWKTEIPTAVNEGTATATIADYKTGQTFELKLTATTKTAQSNNLNVTLGGQNIYSETIDMVQNPTITNKTISLTQINTDGELVITLDNSTIANATLTKTDMTDKKRKGILKLGNDVIQEVEFDFTNGDTITDYELPNISLDKEGTLTLELTQAKFETAKIESIYQKVLTEDEKKGINLELFFIIGDPTEMPQDNTVEVQLLNGKASPLKVLNEIIDRFDKTEDEELDQVGLENLSCKFSGVLEAFFFKREKMNKGTSRGNDIKSILIKEDIDEKTYVYDFIGDADISSNQTATDFYIKINDTTFYVGKVAPKIMGTRKLISNKPVTFEEFMSKLQEQMTLYFPDAGLYEGNLTFISEVEVEAKGLEVNKRMVKQATSARFAVIQKFAVRDSSPDGQFFFSYTPVEREDEAKVWNLTLGYKDNDNTYDICFDPAVVDGFNRSLYYDRVDNDFIHIKLLDGNNMLAKMDTFRWGSAITPRKPTTSDYVSAINSLEDMEEITIDLLWDTGNAHPNITRALDNMARKLKALNIASLPTEYNGDKTGIRKVSEYLDNLNLNSMWSRILWAKVLTGDVGNFGTYINGSALALTNYITNFNGGSTEFCPQFGTNYATMTGSHKIVLKESERNELLDKYRVATIRGGNGIYAYHVNSHTTTQKLRSSYQFEQNVRIANTVAHACDRICYTKIGLPNNYFTRDITKTQIANFIDNRCVNGQIFPIEEYRIICDRRNNSEQDEKNGIMNIAVWLKYTGAVEFVNVYINTITVAGEEAS